MATFDYTSRDFSTIKSEMLDRATQSIPEWTDRDPSDFMTALIDIWAYAADVLHFYVDRAATEAFLPTATQRESVLAMANLYGYTPNPITSAKTGITVYNSTASSVSIPSGTQFRAQSGTTNYIFSTMSDILLAADATATIYAREGIPFSLQTLSGTSGTSVSTGLAGQRFSLYHKNVDPSTITVYVYEGAGQTAVEWRQVSRLTNTAASDSVYTVYIAADGTVQLVFGNGVNGRIPPPNTEIKASYTVSSGANGNLAANSVVSFSNSGFSGVRVVSSTVGAGGLNAEDINSLKITIPRALRTQNRAVTLTDFADIALGVPGVSKAVAQYFPGSGATSGSVAIHAVSYDSSYTSTAASTLTLNQTIREQIYLDAIDVAMLGVGTIGVRETITLTPVYVAVDLYVKSNYVYEWVKRDVLDAINNLFDFQNVSFGQVITIGEFYRAILAVDGVDYAVITNFNTSSLIGGISSSGKITIDQYRLMKRGDVSIANPGGTGVSPPA